jgi:LPXTG-motif cell wall-anchored protein
MNKARWVSGATGTAVLVAGLAVPSGAAFADSGGNGNSGVLSVLSGNNVNAPVSVPVNVCGVAVTLLGGANAGCAGGAASNTVIDPGGSGSGNGNAGVISAGSGNTVNVPVSVPVNVCGVAGSAGGFSHADCQGGSASNTVIKGGSGGNGNGNAGDISALSGNTVNAPVSAPVNACGIAVALLGFSNADCQGGSFSNTNIGSTPAPQPTPCLTTPPPPCQCTTPPSTPPSTPPTTPPTTPPGHHHTPPPTPPTTPPGPGIGPGTGPGTGPGSGPGSTTTTVPGSLPITGANIVGMAVAALGLIGIGGASLAIARRRRNSEV